ncbi:hypothetical protein IAU59_004092 [Kwoniella sp. CBS 9459]
MGDYIESPCDYPGCQNLVILSWAVCWMCNEIRCGVHDSPEMHECSNFNDIESRRIKQRETRRRYFETILVNLRQCQDSIIQDCSNLRPGHTCHLHIPESADRMNEAKIAGTFNVNLQLTFDDGVEWMVRVRQNEGHRPPPQVVDPDIRTEVATLNWLKSNGMPVPGAWLPSHITKLDSGVPGPSIDFFYNELMRGKAWNVPKHMFRRIDLPEDELQRFIEAYAKTQIQLSNLPVPVNKIGCLIPAETGDGVVVGPLVARGCLRSPDPPYWLGPFTTLQERYLTQIESALRFILVGAVCPWAPVDAYLWHLELRELVKGCSVLAKRPDKLYIKHDDARGDHILRDDNGEITGIIDWQWAYVTTKGEAFAPSHSFYECRNYIFHGDNSLARDEKTLIEIYEREGRGDLADCVRNGRLYHRLERIGQYDDSYAKAGFREAFMPLPADLNPPENDHEWREYMMERYRDDEGLQAVIEKYGQK